MKKVLFIILAPIYITLGLFMFVTYEAWAELWSD